MSDRKWSLRFLSLAKVIASWSKDPSTKCGAVISDDKFMVSSGYNGFPKRIRDKPEDYANRELKYRKVIHAEMNAILNARQSLEECTLHVWPFPPCERCAAMIIQSGIYRIVSIWPTTEQIERWGDSIKLAEEMFREADIQVIYYYSDELNL